jgi:two-component system sensor histidine kinase TctE
MLSKRKSLRRQLLLWLIFPLLGIILVSIFSSYQLALHFADIAFDTELEENARALAGQVIKKEEKWTLASPELSEEAFRHHNRDKVYFLITDAAGQEIGGDARLGLPASGKAPFPRFADKTMEGQPVRVVTIKIPLTRNDAQSFMLIQMAETLNERSILANQVLINTIAHQLVLALLAALLVWVAVAHGLKPLEKLRQDIENRTPDELQPLSAEGIPDEVRPLTQTLNRLMMRLEKHIGAQKRFIANAAHQLRTPLAGLQTQLEIALRQDDPAARLHALNQVQISLDRAIHLTEQLLSLAKAEPNGLKFYPVDLTALAKSVTESFVPRALEKNIDLGFNGPENPIVVQGQATNLREMLANLVDNALLYTPFGGQVTVRLVDEGDIRLEVEDTGPGIPEMERDKVFERFYRLNDNGPDGSGLGLSIVQEIVEAHWAKVTLASTSEDRGTLATVVFNKKCVIASQTEVE